MPQDQKWATSRAARLAAGQTGLVCGDDLCRGLASTFRLNRGLRVRLVAVAVCLVAAGTGIIGPASALLARGALMRQAEQQLRAYAALLIRRPFTVRPGSGLAPGGAPGGGFSVQVLSSTGRLVGRAGPGGRAAPAASGRVEAGPGRPAEVPAAGGGQRWLVIAEPVRYRARRVLFTYGADGYSLLINGPHRPGLAGTVIIGLGLTGVDSSASRLALTWLAVSGTVTVAVAVLGGTGVRALLRPLAAVEQTAGAVRPGEFAHRVPDRAASGEAGSLTRSVNAMLRGLERRFSDSAQAEAAARESAGRLSGLIIGTGGKLRRPIGVIHGLAGYCRQRGRLGTDELDHLMRRMAAEAARLDALIDELRRSGRPPGRAG